MKDDSHEKPMPAKDALFELSAPRIVEGSGRLTADQQRHGREQRKIESRVCGIAAPAKGAS